MDYIIIISYSLFCFSMGFWVSVKLNLEHEKSVEDLLQAHREYEEALWRGYKLIKEVADERGEMIEQLIGGQNDV